MNKKYISEINSIFDIIKTNLSFGKKITLKNVYTILATYSYKREEVGVPLLEYHEEILADSLRYISQYKKRILDGEIPNDVTINLSMKKNNYTKLSVRYDECVDCGEREKFDVHIPLLQSQFVECSRDILNFLLENRISNVSYLANKVGKDNLIVSLYNKEDILKLSDFCSSNLKIKESLLINNPFLPRVGDLGITKETAGIPYIRQLSKLLYNYLYSKDSSDYNAYDFYKYVMNLSNNPDYDNSTERYLNYQILLGMYSLLSGTEYLTHDHLKSSNLKFDINELRKYRISSIDSKNVYFDSMGNKITEESNYKLWTHLQSLLCMMKMYNETYGTEPTESFNISSKLTSSISKTVNLMLDEGQTKVNVKNGYLDPNAGKLLPYLYGEFAYQNAFANTSEVRSVVSNLEKCILNTLPSKNNDDIQFTSVVNNKIIPSSIPVLNVMGGYIGIEILDKDTNYCNIYMFKDGRILNELNAFLDVNFNLLADIDNNYSSMYRSCIAYMIINSKNNYRIMTERNKHYGYLLSMIGENANLSRLIEDKYTKAQEGKSFK